MSWVRYDDGFDCHPKVTAVIAEDAGAVALHVLANTWAARQKRPDFVPSHQPGLLVGSKTKGAKWAGLLERHGLWNAVDGGWEFHDHAAYRNTARQTPGTPADLSEKRAAAGRRGGKTAQQRKQTAKQTVEQNEQDVKQPASNPLSPVVASSEATPVPVPSSTGHDLVPAAGDTTSALISEWLEHCAKRPPNALIGQVGKSLKAMLAEGVDPTDVRRGLAQWAAKGLNPSALPSVVNEIMNAGPQLPRQSRNTTILAGAYERAQQAERTSA